MQFRSQTHWRSPYHARSLFFYYLICLQFCQSAAIVFLALAQSDRTAWQQHELNRIG
ncbi:MAG TPA: hypothetical protein IGS53_22770 [Leptolyngbyaceae cyanobacterium M33_DOE_097]|nr:hypothetical protein [Leptolyngbyaceae cyanobacterium M33_DOE_097]